MSVCDVSVCVCVMCVFVMCVCVCNELSVRLCTCMKKKHVWMYACVYVLFYLGIHMTVGVCI